MWIQIRKFNVDGEILKFNEVQGLHSSNDRLNQHH